MASDVEVAPWRRRLEADRLCVMGPVALLVDGRQDVLPAMPARLVTLLCCSIDRWVSLETLIDDLWAGAPPESARPAMHVHLGSIRRWLARSASGASIKRSASGYQIAFAGLELDWMLMEDLIEQAGGASVVASEAVEILESALSLLRGPLGGASDASGSIAVVAERIDRSRLAGEEDLVEALLATGSFRSAEAVGVRLIENNPFRELRWAQLMRARYLDNRPREALATYKEARELLIGELGSEPGPMLQSVERMVLMHDRAGLASDPRRRATAATTLAVVGPLFGREAELRRCIEGLTANRVVVVHGPPGVGKTRLARETGRLSEATNTVFWVDLQAQVDPGKAVALAVGAPPDSGLRHVCEVLAGLRSLLVLDNADHVASAVDELVSALQRALPELRLLITSRARLSVPAVRVELRPLPLPSLEDPDDVFDANPSVRLLHGALADLAPATRVSRAEALQLCTMTGGLPLALRLAAGELRALGTTSRIDLARVAVSSQLGSMVRATLTLQSASRRHVFNSLSVLVGEFDAECGAAVAGIPTDEFLGAVIDLVDSGLIEMVPGPPARYRILPPLRDVTVGELLDDRTRRDSLDRLTDHVISEARALGRAIRQGESVDGVEPRTFGLVLLAQPVMKHLSTAGDAERALELAGRLDAALYTLGWWTEKNELLEHALAIPGRPTAVRARALALRGRAGLLSQFDLRHLIAAEHMAIGLGEDILAAFAVHLRGIAMWWSGDYEASLGANRMALAMFGAAGRTIEMLEARKFVGLALLQSGRADEGFREQHQVLVRFKHLGIAFPVAHSLALLGHSYRHVGDDVAATVDLRASLEICRSIGNRGTAIHVQLGLGDIAIDAGDCDSAQRYATDALAMITRSQLRAYEPWAWTLAMRTAIWAGDVDRSLGCGGRAVAALDFAPGGDAARLAFELAEVALVLDDPVSAARLVGSARAHSEPREMPLPAPSDQRRHDAVADMVEQALGPEAARHVAAGRRCTIVEAAGDLLQRPGNPTR